MIDVVTESTTITIKILDKGLTSEMLYNISQIGNVKKAKLDAEAEKIKAEEDAFFDSTNHSERDWDNYDKLKEKLEEAYIRCCSGYQFYLSLHIGDAPEGVYYTYHAFRTASEKEVQDIIQKIKEICVGVEIEIECERYKIDEQLYYDLMHPKWHISEEDTEEDSDD
jgi:hypothetical protein